jgi:fructose-bisphosphate aldolase class II
MKAFEWLKRAQAEKFAIGAFNGASMETFRAIVQAAAKLASPVIIEASHSEVEFFGMTEMVAVVRALEKDFKVPVILNLDHAPDLESCLRAIEVGFDYIHFDGSKMPYEKNVRVAKMVVTAAHVRRIPVEGEMDYIGGSSADHRGEEALDVSCLAAFTDPENARLFVLETGIDTFAGFFGNVHGLYGGQKNIDLDLLKRIKESIPTKFLSLHGGSGIPGDQVKEAIKEGIVKINVNSELRVAYAEELKKTLSEPNQKEVAIYKLMPKTIKAVQEIVEEKILLFGSAGKV